MGRTLARIALKKQTVRDVTPGQLGRARGRRPSAAERRLFVAKTSRTRPASNAKLHDMQALKVQVKNGRLVLDEPTDLPDGAEVEIVVLDDDLSPEERAALHASLDRALDDSEAGRGMDAAEYLRQYRARREGRPAR